MSLTRNDRKVERVRESLTFKLLVGNSSRRGTSGGREVRKELKLGDKVKLFLKTFKQCQEVPPDLVLLVTDPSTEIPLVPPHQLN